MWEADCDAWGTVQHRLGDRIEGGRLLHDHWGTPMSDDDPLATISAAEARRRLRMSKKVFAHEVKHNGLPWVRDVGAGKRKKYRPVEIAAWLERRTRGCEVLSDDAKVDRAGTRTSQSRVVDFETALAMTGREPKRPPPNSSPKPSLVTARRKKPK